MRQTEFDNLNRSAQARMIRDKGVLIGRANRPQLIFLYQIHGFYVEIYFLRKKDSNAYCYKGKKTFEDTDLLDPYLENMHLPPF